MAGIAPSTAPKSAPISSPIQGGKPDGGMAPNSNPGNFGGRPSPVPASGNKGPR